MPSAMSRMRQIPAVHRAYVHLHATADIMNTTTVVNKTLPRTAEHMEIHAPKPMQRQHAPVAPVFIHVKPIIATFPVHV